MMRFTELFTYELYQWRSSLQQEDFQTMTLRQAYTSFMASWKAEQHSLNEQQILAKGTFMYFFRHHEIFDLLAKQVLSGYDDTCRAMRGIPLDPRAGLSSAEFTFVFRSSTGPSDTPEAGGSSTQSRTPLHSPSLSSAGSSGVHSQVSLTQSMGAQLGIGPDPLPRLSQFNLFSPVSSSVVSPGAPLPPIPPLSDSVPRSQRARAQSQEQNPPEPTRKPKKTSGKAKEKGSSSKDRKIENAVA